MRRVGVTVLCLALMMGTLVAQEAGEASPKPALNAAARAVLEEIDADQYSLQREGVTAIQAAYTMTAEGIMEVGDRVLLSVTWTAADGFAVAVDSDDWDSFHPDDVRRELADFLDDLLLGRRFAEMLKDFNVAITEEDGGRVVEAENPDLHPQYAKLWFDKKNRMTRAVIRSRDITYAEFEFENLSFHKRWIIDQIRVKKITTTDEDNITRGFESILVEYEDVKNAAGETVRILSHARATGRLYGIDENGNPDPEDPGEDVNLELKLDRKSLRVE